ncbi:MAG: hypothetical protein GC150_10305 [Rhizobiales bacterium]|nr:hypothetical protein [Hyphomicrobiales bacterium]
MVQRIEELLGRMRKARRQFAEELSRLAAYRALNQLDAREGAGEALEAVDPQRLRSSLVAELSSVGSYARLVALDRAVAVLERPRVVVGLRNEVAPSAVEEASSGPAPAASVDEADPAVPVIHVTLADAAADAAGHAPIAQSIDPTVAAAPPPTVSTPLPDDLTRIRGIDPALATALADLGIDRFASIARWRHEDVLQVGRALGLGPRISRECWIEQSAILAAGGATDFDRRPPIRLVTRPDGEPSVRLATTPREPVAVVPAPNGLAAIAAPSESPPASRSDAIAPVAVADAEVAVEAPSPARWLETPLAPEAIRPAGGAALLAALAAANGEDAIEARLSDLFEMPAEAARPDAQPLEAVGTPQVEPHPDRATPTVPSDRPTSAAVSAAVAAASIVNADLVAVPRAPSGETAAVETTWDEPAEEARADDEVRVVFADEWMVEPSDAAPDVALEEVPTTATTSAAAPPSGQSVARSQEIAERREPGPTSGLPAAASVAPDRTAQPTSRSAFGTTLNSGNVVPRRTDSPALRGAGPTATRAEQEPDGRAMLRGEVGEATVTIVRHAERLDDNSRIDSVRRQSGLPPQPSPPMVVSRQRARVGLVRRFIRALRGPEDERL